MPPPAVSPLRWALNVSTPKPGLVLVWSMSPTGKPPLKNISNRSTVKPLRTRKLPTHFRWLASSHPGAKLSLPRILVQAPSPSRPNNDVPGDHPVVADLAAGHRTMRFEVRGEIDESRRPRRIVDVLV